MGSYWSLFQCWNYKNKVHSQKRRLSLTLFILGFLGFRSTGGQFAPPPSFISELLMIWFWNLAWLWTNSRESFWLAFFDDVIIFLLTSSKSNNITQIFVCVRFLEVLLKTEFWKLKKLLQTKKQSTG